MVTSVDPDPPSEPPDPPPDETGGEMTLLGHLLELRSRVTWMAGAIVVGMGAFFAPPINFAIWEILLEPASDVPGFRPTQVDPLENLGVYFRIALACGMAVAMPVLVYQTMRFVAPALTKQEKRWLYPIALGASLAFLTGLALLLLRRVAGRPTASSSSSGASSPRRSRGFSSYMDLTLRLLVLLGFVFEMPILIMGLARIRVVHWRRLLGWWRIAIIGAFVVSAIATPTIDPVTQSLVAGPMIILYAFGIGLAWIVRPRG